MMRASLCFFVPLAFVLGCDGAAGVGGNGGEGEGEGGAGTDDMVLDSSNVVDADAVLSAGLAVAVRSDGRVAFIYLKNGDGGTVGCINFGGTGTTTAALFDVVVVDEQADGSFRSRTIDSVPPMFDDSIDLAVDPASDALVAAYMGGAVATGYCGASDLVVNVESGDTFTKSTIAQNSSDGSGPCRTVQQVCAKGDVVGRFPGISIGQAAWAIAYGDMHFGFASDDLNRSDVELVMGSGPGNVSRITTVSGDSGAGYNSSSALTADGRAVVGTAIIATNSMEDPNDPNGSLTVQEGIWMYTQQTDGTFAEALIAPEGAVADRISVAATSTGIYAAFRDVGSKQLAVFRSVDDGVSFTGEFPERLGLTGFYPTIGFLSDGAEVLAYSHCKDIDDNNPTCDNKQDGVRVTWKSKDATAFKKKVFKGDDEDEDGLKTDMAIAADDTIITLGYNASKSQVVINHITHKVTP